MTRRNHHRQSRHKTFLKTILILLCIIIAFMGILFVLKNSLLYVNLAKGSLKSSDISAFSTKKISLADDQLNSKNAILLDLNTKKILYEKDCQEKIYPASMTKIMTAVIVLENTGKLKQKVLLDDGVFNDIYSKDAATAGFLPQEKVKVIDLLYGLMLASGTECAEGLAKHVAGSEEDFVILMNDKAQELGLKNTHFTNTTGLHDKNHYSTVKDIALLLKYALKDNNFYEVFTSTQYTTASTNLHPDGITLNSTLNADSHNLDFNNGFILGGKTGYTKKAGQCLASLGKANKKLYIAVTADAKGNPKTQTLHLDDALTIYNAISTVPNN